MSISKVYDVIFYFNEIETLKSRINYLGKNVHRRIIFNFGDDHIDIEGVDIIPVMEDYQDFIKKNFVVKIFNFIGKKNINPMDIFIFSKTFEIPTEESLNQFLNSFEVGPKIFNKDLYFHNINLKSIYKKPGGSISRYTGLITLNNPQYTLFSENFKFTYNKEELLEGGISILNFENAERSIESLRYWFPKFYNNMSMEDLYSHEERHSNPDNSLKPHILSFISNKRLSNFFKKYPINLKTKKILLTFFYLKIDSNLYDEVYYLTDDNIKINDIETIKIRKPKNLFYKSANYPSDFKLNEILTVLNTFVLHDEDEIHIKTKTVGDPTVFKYKDLKNTIPSDIIGTSSF